MIVIYRGDDWDNPFTTTTSTLNFTGCSVRCHVRNHPDASEKIAATVVVNANTGTTLNYNVKLSHDQTQAMNGDYVGDVEVTFADGKVRTVAAFQLTITRDVTHGV